MRKKGQAAMEFIMTYGWAILIFIAVISTLAYFDVFDSKKGIPSVCTIGPGFGCKDTKATADSIVITLRNGPLRDVTEISFGFDGSALDCTTAQSTDPADALIPANGAKTDKWWFNSTNTLIPEGKDIADFSFTGCTNSQRAMTYFIIDYVIAGETVNHQVEGQANLKVE